MRGKVRGHQAARRWFALAEDTLSAHRDSLNRLNVFPVADSDTGLNMIATVRAAARALDRAEGDDLGQLLSRAGAEAMVEARGNSGTLLAVLISGIAEPLHGHDRLTPDVLSAALHRGSLRAWSALSHPVPGTMLSVVDAVAAHVAEQAGVAEEPESRAALTAAVAEMDQVARRAVIATEGQLDALRQAGVVDSGGAGMLLILAALKATITGSPVDDSVVAGLSGWEADDGAPAEQPQAARTSGDSLGAEGRPGNGVEIMCTLRLDPLGAASLRHHLDEIGDSVIITPIDVDADAAGGYRWRIHVHSEEEEPTAAALREAGPVEHYQATPLLRGR